jgi:hypothetical protein
MTEPKRVSPTKSRRVAAMSRIYFSSPRVGAERTRRRGEGPVAFVPVRNAAGPAGAEALEAIRSILHGSGFLSRVLAAEEGSFRSGGDRAGRLTGVAFLRKLENEGDASLLFVRLEGALDPVALTLAGLGDVSLLLVSGEIASLRSGYLYLKDLKRMEGGTVPVLLPVGARDDRWSRLAPGRLAEGVFRFLGQKISIWGDPGEAAGRLAELIRSMSGRREQGSGAVVRRLAPLMGGPDE